MAEIQGELFAQLEQQQKPVECLGKTFESDEARRAYFLEKLREKLKDSEFRTIKGFPIGEDEDILAFFSKLFDNIKIQVDPQKIARSPWVEARLSLLKWLYPCFHNDEIAACLGLKVYQLADKASRLGLRKAPEFRRLTRQQVIKKAQSAPNSRQGSRKYTINVNYFKTWSAKMAYFLGYIAADGCLSQRDDYNRHYCVLNWQIHKRDREALEAFCQDSDATYPIKTMLQDRVCLYITEQTMCSDLIALGITPRKSLTLQMPPVPEPCIRDFIRGYSDGDGSIGFACSKSHNQNTGHTAISKYIQWMVYGTPELLYAIREHLGLVVNVWGSIYPHSRTGKNTSVLKFSACKAEAALSYIYEDSPVHLSRKYERWIDWQSTKTDRRKKQQIAS